MAKTLKKNKRRAITTSSFVFSIFVISCSRKLVTATRPVTKEKAVPKETRTFLYILVFSVPLVLHCLKYINDLIIEVYAL